MKIAIFSDNFYPEISGISDSVIMLGKELSALGHEVHFFSAKYSARDYAVADMQIGEPDLGEKIKLHRFWSLPMLGSPTGQSRVVIPFALRCLKFRNEKFDIVYAQSPYGMGMEALFMSRMFGIPLIGTNHTPITEFTRYIPLSNLLFDWIGLKFVAWYYNRCKFVTAPFAGILDEMKVYGFKRSSLELSNPIDLKNFFPAGGDKKQELKNKFSFTDKTVLYAGRIAPEKQVDVIIKAMAEVRKEIPSAMLAITGIGNAENDLKKLAKDLGTEDSVKFFGRVDDHTHAETYRAAELFVVMSTAETQCISMMKAMSSGVPVIGADAWALPNYIGRDEKLGFVIPVGDVKTLTEKIILLLNDQEKSQQMGQAGMEYVKQFSARSVAEKWQEIFFEYSSDKKSAASSDLKLSFVIPAYNEENYIGNCLESVFSEIKKSNFKVEVIVVNNASKDRTKEVALSFPGVRVVDEFEKGLVKARRAGFMASSGDIIANVDSDATLPEGWLKKVFEEFEKDPELAALSGPYIYPEMSKFYNILVNVYYRIGYLGHLFNHYVLKSGAVLQGGNFVVRRTAMEKIGGFDTSIEFYGEDTDVARRIQKVGRVNFTFSLPMYTSSRRFDGDGFYKTAYTYAINHFWTIIFKRPFTMRHNDFRSGVKVLQEYDKSK